VKIELTPEHEDWIRREVAAGRYTSVDQAIGTALARFIADEESPGAFDEDLDWAKPLIEEGIADADAGRLLTADEVMEQVRARLRAKA
jgi:antitoxin ParD1/3/4